MRHSGCSLIELCAATAVLAVLSLGLFAVTTGSEKAMVHATQKAFMHRNLREALREIARNLSSVYIAKSCDIYFLYGSSRPTQYLNWQASVTAPSVSGELLFTMARQPSTSAVQDIYELGYYINSRATADDPRDDVLEKYTNTDPNSAQIPGRGGGKMPYIDDVIGLEPAFWGPDTVSWETDEDAQTHTHGFAYCCWDSSIADNLTPTSYNPHDEGSLPDAVMLTAYAMPRFRINELLRGGLLPQEPAFLRQRTALSTIVYVPASSNE